jgi:hypothetical protein
VKFLALGIAAFNLYIGLHNFLNVIHVLHNSKYSTASTTVFAILFLGLGAAGLYFAIRGGSVKYALWLGVGPWVLSLAVLFVSMLLGSHQ